MKKKPTKTKPPAGKPAPDKAAARPSNSEVLDEIEALRRELDALQAFRTNRGDPSGPTAPPAATANQ